MWAKKEQIVFELLKYELPGRPFTCVFVKMKDQISRFGNSLPALFGGKGIQSSYCKYLSLVTQNNNALSCTRKNLEENFIRAFIVLQILALWEN